MWHTAQKVMQCAHDKHEKHHGHEKNMQKNLFPDCYLAGHSVSS